MKHLQFNSFKEFFDYFELPKSCTIRLTSDETAYFEFKPYEKDNVVIKGWVHEFDHYNVQVSFKYREFSLGSDTWSLEYANKMIGKIDYYFEEYED